MRTIFFLALLFVAAYAAVDTPGNLDITINKADEIAATYTSEDGSATVSFISQQSLLYVYTGQDKSTLFNAINYGAFTHLEIPGLDATYLISNNRKADQIVIDVSYRNLVLPTIDTSIAHTVEENADFLARIAGNTTTDAIVSAQESLSSFFFSAITTREVAAMPYLSMKLASNLITGTTHPASLPLHGTSLEFMKLRGDQFDTDMLAQVNELFHSDKESSDVGCSIIDYCGNECFGMCGYGCTCIEWWCGTCGCHVGCYEHDYCCSCEGMFTPCCINFVFWSCDE